MMKRLKTVQFGVEALQCAYDTPTDIFTAMPFMAMALRGTGVVRVWFRMWTEGTCDQIFNLTVNGCSIFKVMFGQ